MSRPKIPRLVVVKWYDACLFDRGGELKECLERKLPIYKTHGILIGRDETIVRVACEEIVDNSDFKKYRQLNLIPTGSVISIKTLKEQHGAKS